jgi:hypothetical protein
MDTLDIIRSLDNWRGALKNISDDCGLSWGHPQFEHCKLQLSLKQLMQREMEGRPPQHRTGGLGRKMQESVFEVRQSAFLCNATMCVCTMICVCVCALCDTEKKTETGGRNVRVSVRVRVF